MTGGSHERQGRHEPGPLLRIEIYGPPGVSTSIGSASPSPVSRPAPTAFEPADDVARREAEVTRREQALDGSEGLLDAGVADVKRRERKLRDMETALQQRLRDLDEREVEVDRREIELESAFGLREDRIETREAQLAELGDRLQRKEEDLARYVGQVQAQFSQRG